MSVSAASPASPATGGTAGAGVRALATAGESCPLCGAPLAPEQEWCLSCGAAARTRLAAPPNWKAPIIAVLVVVVLSFGVLAAALVKLTASSDSGAAVATKTVITAPAQVSQPTTTTTAPGAVAPGVPLFGTGGSGTTTPSTPTTTAPGGTAAPTTTNPGTAPRTTTRPTAPRTKAPGSVGGATPTTPGVTHKQTPPASEPGVPGKARQRSLFNKLPPAVKKKLLELSHTG